MNNMRIRIEEFIEMRRLKWVEFYSFDRFGDKLSEQLLSLSI